MGAPLLLGSLYGILAGLALTILLMPYPGNGLDSDFNGEPVNNFLKKHGFIGNISDKWIILNKFFNFFF